MEMIIIPRKQAKSHLLAQKDEHSLSLDVQLFRYLPLPVSVGAVREPPLSFPLSVCVGAVREPPLSFPLHKRSP